MLSVTVAVLGVVLSLHGHVSHLSRPSGGGVEWTPAGAQGGLSLVGYTARLLSSALWWLGPDLAFLTPLRTSIIMILLPGMDGIHQTRYKRTGNVLWLSRKFCGSILLSPGDNIAEVLHPAH